MTATRILPFFLFILVGLFSPSAVEAQLVEQKGVGSVSYKGVFGISTEKKQEAVRRAQLDALRRYVADMSQSRRDEYNAVRSTIEGNVGRYVRVARVLSEKRNKDLKRFEVVIRAEIDEGLIRQQLSETAEVANVPDAERSLLTFIFVARKAASVRTFDDKETTVTRSTETSEAAHSTNASDTGLVVEEGSTSTSVEQSGGSTEVKADQIQYTVTESAGINSTLTRIFGDAKYVVIESEMVAAETGGLMDLKAFKEDFANGTDIAAPTRSNAAKGCRNVGIRFLAIGNLDIGRNLEDSASGLTKVFVNVSGKVYDVSRRFPVTVATIGPVQYSGQGPTQPVAERNALLLAGEEAAQELVSQMRAKNLY